MGTGWVVQDDLLLLLSGGEWGRRFQFLLMNQGSFFFLLFVVRMFLFHSADTSLALKMVMRLSCLYAYSSDRLGQSGAMMVDEVPSYCGCRMTKGRPLAAVAVI